jgi:hypothetical protein
VHVDVVAGAVQPPGRENAGPALSALGKLKVWSSVPPGHTSHC